ncbi:hypothetical protein TNCV_723701 [Trichonephila clavipes]|nr:hypothetical protein TNCV_723701 [Trichonephila clavipes]
MSVVSQFKHSPKRLSLLLSYTRPRLCVSLSPKEFYFLWPKTIQRFPLSKHKGLFLPSTVLSGVEKPSPLVHSVAKPSPPKYSNPSEVVPIRANIPYSFSNSSLRHYSSPLSL